MKTQADEAWKAKWTGDAKAAAKEARTKAEGRKMSRGAWIFIYANLFVLALALVVRLATPQVILTPIAYLRPASLSVTNISQRIYSDVLVISRTPTKPTILQFNSRVVNFDNYLTSVMLRLPEYSQGLYEESFIISLHAVKRLTVDWCTSDRPHTADEATDLTAKLMSLRANFGKWTTAPPKRKRAPLWYLHIARVSMGLSEGMLAPFCAGWRAIECFLMPSRTDARSLFGSGARRHATNASLRRWSSGRRAPWSLKARYILAPDDWRREGPFFALALLYGAIAGAYLLSFAGQRLNWSFLPVLGVVVAIYGILSFSVFCASYNKEFDAWFTRQTSSFYSLFDFLLPKNK